MFVEQGKLTIGFNATAQHVLIWLLITGIFLIDLAMPSGVSVPMLYIMPLAFTTWTRTRAVVFSAAGACLGLTFLGYVLSSSDLGHSGPYNRALSMIFLAGCTYMALVNQRHRMMIVEAYHDRCRGEEDLKQLGAKLEQRVEERTAELQAARRAALNILDDTEWARQRAEQAEAELRAAHAELGLRVMKRTTELTHANDQLSRRVSKGRRGRAVSVGGGGSTDRHDHGQSGGTHRVSQCPDREGVGYHRSELLG